MSTHPTAGSAAANQFGVFKVHYATPAQVGFIRSLFAGRDLSQLASSIRSEVEDLRSAVDAGEINKKAASRLIDVLLPLPELPKSAATAVPAGPPASDKQVAFVRKLIGEKDLTGTAYPAWDEAIFTSLTKTAASKAIDHLLKLPRATAPAAVPGTGGPVEGMHYIDGEVIKVQRAVHGSGNLYAKRLVIDVPAELAADGSVVTPAVAHFEYAPGVVGRTSVATLMTKEDGARFGRLYGMCVKCAATLTDEASIERGMGPICAGKGWAN